MCFTGILPSRKFFMFFTCFLFMELNNKKLRLLVIKYIYKIPLNFLSACIQRIMFRSMLHSINIYTKLIFFNYMKPNWIYPLEFISVKWNSVFIEWTTTDYILCIRIMKKYYDVFNGKAYHILPQNKNRHSKSTCLCINCIQKWRWLGGKLCICIVTRILP